jgi:hypothetical protein
VGNPDGFSVGRRHIDVHDLSPPGPSAKLLRYPNVPQIIGLIVANDRATFNELQTVYGWEDAYDLLEIIIIDSQNRKRMMPKPS